MKKQIIILLTCGMLVVATGFINSAKTNFTLNSEGNLPEMLIPGNMDIADGKYLIRSSITTDKYLDVDANKDGETVTLNRLGDAIKDNTWEVKKVNGPLGGYTIANVKYSNKYLDAEFNSTAKNGCKVQIWQRTGPSGNLNPINGGNLLPTNQEWYIQKAKGANNAYRIANIKNSDMYLDAKDDGTADSRVKLWKKTSGDKTQIWIFEKQ